MRDWHQNWRTDIGLRLSGVALWGLSWLATRKLILLLPEPSASPGTGAFALAAAAFLCASLGGILLTLGDHIFDRIEIDERWRALPPPDTWQPEPTRGGTETAAALALPNKENQGAFNLTRSA